MRPEQKKKLAAVLFWLAVWQLAAVLIGHSLILVGPVQVLGCLWRLVGEGAFWQSVGQTAVRILQGYLLGVAAGGLLAGAAMAEHMSYPTAKRKQNQFIRLVGEKMGLT